MKLFKVSDIQGGEILARDVMTASYTQLLSRGTILRKDYISKLEEQGIYEIWVEETSEEKLNILKNEVVRDIKENVRDVMEKHSYLNSGELSELTKSVDSIIVDIMEQEEIAHEILEIKGRKPDIYEHSISVSSLSVLMALRMGLDHVEVREIGIGALLHDIGIRYISIQYENTDLSKGNKPDVVEYRKHPLYGYSSIKDETWISEYSKNMILYHHERVNGSGYPLSATDLSTGVKIIGIVDTFDEMISGIGYKQKAVHEAVEYIKKNRNTIFDYEIVNVFLDFTAEYPAGSTVLTSEGEVGIVLRQSKETPDKPYIKVIKNKNGELVQSDIVKDLSTQEGVTIVKLIK